MLGLNWGVVLSKAREDCLALWIKLYVTCMSHITAHRASIKSCHTYQIMSHPHHTMYVLCHITHNPRGLGSRSSSVCVATGICGVLGPAQPSPAQPGNTAPLSRDTPSRLTVILGPRSSSRSEAPPIDSLPPDQPPHYNKSEAVRNQPYSSHTAGRVWLGKCLYLST